MLKRATKRRDAARAAQMHQHTAAASNGGPIQQLHPPNTWNREQAFLRMGRWCGFSREPWTSSDLGGSDIKRPLQLYAADLASVSQKGGCNKYKQSNRKLVPGCMLYWCQDCGRCVGFSVMDHAESVLVPFEFMYTGCETAPDSFQLDNGCNLDQSIRNREPEFFKAMQLYIDEAHYRGHVTCSENYNTRAIWPLHVLLQPLQHTCPPSLIL